MDDENKNINERIPAAGEDEKPYTPPQARFSPILPQTDNASYKNPPPAQHAQQCRQDKDKQYVPYTPPYPGGQGGNIPAQPKKKRSKAGVVIAIIAIALACLILGGVLGAAVLYSYRGAAQQATVPADPAAEVHEPVPLPEKEDEPASAEVPSFGGSASGTEFGSFADIYEEIAPAVVDIELYDTSLDDGRVSEKSLAGYSSGTVISEEGHIIFNNHSAVAGDHFNVIFSDGTEVEAKLLGSDPSTDIGLLKIEPFEGMKVAPLGDSDSIRTGEEVVVIGYPDGSGLSGTLTGGYISSVGAEITMDTLTIEVMQIDAAINPGNSGGPVVNMAGEVIGIISAKQLTAGYDEYGLEISAEGMGYAIPINNATAAAEQIIQYGGVRKPGIGITGRDVTEEETAMYGVPSGVIVYEVTEGGASDRAGIKQYDIITAMDGVELDGIAALKEELSKREIGDTIKLTVWRDGKSRTVTIELMDINGK